MSKLSLNKRGILCFCAVLLMFLATILSAQPVQAALVNEQFGFGNYLVDAKFSGTNLGSATSLKLNSQWNLIDSNPDSYLGMDQTIDLYTTLESVADRGSILYADQVTLDFLSLRDLEIIEGPVIPNLSYQSVDFGSFLSFGPTENQLRFEFDMTGVNFFSSSWDSLVLVGMGDLRDTSGEYDDTPATIRMDFTYAGKDSKMNYTGTFATAAPVPIPSAAWLLSGGLIGLIALRRRNN